MATTAIGRKPGTARWVMPAALLLIVSLGLLMLWATPWIAPYSAQQKALLLERVAAGGLLNHGLAAGHGLAWIALVILLRPMLLLAFVVLIEAWLTRGQPRHQDRALAWTARALFLVVTHISDMTLGRFVPIPLGPIFDFANAATPSGLRTLQTGFLFLLAMLIAEFFQYWAHRAYHHFPFLWRFHAVHHAPRDLDVLHRFEHPVEALVSWFLIVVPVTILIAGADSGQLSVVAAFLMVRDDLLHTKAPINFGPLGRVLVDNRYHFIHHGREERHHDRNFAAVFPLFDIIFGTYVKPEKGKLPVTGLDDRLPPDRLSQYFFANLPAAPPAESTGASGSGSGSPRALPA